MGPQKVGPFFWLCFWWQMLRKAGVSSLLGWNNLWICRHLSILSCLLGLLWFCSSKHTPCSSQRYTNPYLHCKQCLLPGTCYSPQACRAWICSAAAGEQPVPHHCKDLASYLGAAFAVQPHAFQQSMVDVAFTQQAGEAQWVVLLLITSPYTCFLAPEHLF